MKKLILLAAVILSSLMAHAENNTFSGYSDIDDLALIYIGSQHRPHWTKEQFRPYVMHTFADGTQSWMFDGFLMIEFTAWNKNNVQVNFGEFDAQGAQKEDMEWLLDRQLGITTGEGCMALDELIGELIPVLGQPGHKHKVVMTIPTAEQGLGMAWGEVAGSQLNLSYPTDRLKVYQWFTDLLLTKWQQCNFKNLDLEGVYWVKEAFNDTQVSDVKAANSYIHSKGLNVYWIPYLKATGRERWREADIDFAYIQPNYYFSVENPYDRLVQATDEVWDDMFAGIEMEFEGYNYNWSAGMTDAVRVTAKNTGLFAIHPEYYQRLIDYIDIFETEGIFDNFPIAYYSGFQGVYDFVNSSHPKDAQLMHRLAKLLVGRHLYTEFDTKSSAALAAAGINDVSVGDQSIAYPIDGGIFITNEDAEKIDIYTVDGKNIYSGVAVEGHIVPCSKGIYVVRSGGKSVKVAVR